MTAPAVLPTITVTADPFPIVPTVKTTETYAPQLRAPTVPLALQGQPGQPAPTVNWWLLGLAAVGLWLVLSGRAGQGRRSW